VNQPDQPMAWCRTPSCVLEDGHGGSCASSLQEVGLKQELAAKDAEIAALRTGIASLIMATELATTHLPEDRQAVLAAIAQARAALNGTP
jgi:hypothetical protein